MAISLLKKHGLDRQGWRFQYDNAKKRFGTCNYRKKAITLSRPLTMLNNEEHVRDTILHEIAHALCPRHGHDWVWRSKAIEIGCNGMRCFSSDEVVLPEPKYIGVCHKCGRVSKKNRMPKHAKSCGKCSPDGFSLEFMFHYILNPKYIPNKLLR